MIIFGWGYQTLKRFGPVQKTSCSKCRNETSWHLRKVTSWITLFFIPVIPYHMKYLLVCSDCGYSLELEREEFEELKEKAGRVDEQFFKQDIMRDDMAMDTGRVIRTETQINFIKQMKELEANKKD